MNAAEILDDMLGALRGELADGYDLVSDFAERQGRMLAKQAEHLALTIEQAWNAVANALWGGMRTILTGAGVPPNLLPATPPLAA